MIYSLKDPSEGPVEDVGEIEVEEKHDNLSEHYCGSCGVRLRVDEYEDFEDTCTECAWEQTSGLIDDSPESELGDTDED